MTDLALEDVQDVAGELTVGRTISLKLDDEQVLVARVTQLKTGPVECIAEGCFRRFETERAMHSHAGKAHPDLPTRSRTCPGCEDEFEPRWADQKYCSRDCYFEHREGGRVQLICENCDQPFEVKASHADERRHCSKECRKANPEGYRRYETRENSREEFTCMHCGEVFEAYPAREPSYCSRECYSASRREILTCRMCGLEFEVRQGDNPEQEYCSRPCAFEHRRRDDRPTDPVELVEEIAGEFDDVENVIGRSLAHLRGDLDELDVVIRAARAAEMRWDDVVDEAASALDDDDHDAALERLVEQLVGDLELPSHIGVQEVREVLQDATTVYEAEKVLRCGRPATRELARELGIEDRLNFGYRSRELLRDVRENLDISEEGEVDRPEEATRFDDLVAKSQGGSS